MVYTNDFETVYSHYPLKKGKFQAQKTWSKLKQDGQLPEADVMIKSIHDQIKERRFLKSQNRFCPVWKHFSTWLNAGCWTDECVFTDITPKAQPKPQVSNINNLYRAYNVLVACGHEKFEEFCRGVNLTANDREAVENKYNLSFNVNELAQRAVKGV